MSVGNDKCSDFGIVIVLKKSYHCDDKQNKERSRYFGERAIAL
jgi:hypothetical protein